jgi:membrane-bound lytic murein transglycosylase D
MWQFIQSRGKEYGLIQNRVFDDRLDPEKSTRAAARHLRDLFTSFGDWNLAMAAYNCGPGCVDRAIQRTGYADFWELANRRALPSQTMKYVPLIQAITIMAKNLKDYGLDMVEPDRPIEYDTMVMQSPTSVDLIADITNRPVSEIRDLNPALLANIAPAGYSLHIPKGASPSLLGALETVPLQHRSNWRMHRVERGETLAEIASRFHAQAALIAAANNRTVEGPEAGDLLVIPISSQPQHVSSTSHRSAQKSYVAVRKSPVRSTAPRTYATRIVPVTTSPRVLHHRAAARSLKTAGIYTPTAGGQ